MVSWLVFTKRGKLRTRLWHCCGKSHLESISRTAAGLYWATRPQQKGETIPVVIQIERQGGWRLAALRSGNEHLVCLSGTAASDSIQFLINGSHDNFRMQERQMSIIALVTCECNFLTQNLFLGLGKRWANKMRLCHCCWSDCYRTSLKSGWVHFSISATSGAKRLNECRVFGVLSQRIVCT